MRSQHVFSIIQLQDDDLEDDEDFEDETDGETDGEGDDEEGEDEDEDEDEEEPWQVGQRLDFRSPSSYTGPVSNLST